MTIKTAKVALSLIWVIAAIPLMLVLIMRQISGEFDDSAKSAWTWAGQFLFPNLTLIGGAWSVTASPNEDKPMSSVLVFWIAIALSLFYLLVLYLVLGWQQTSSESPQSVYEQSAQFLVLIQALVVGWLGKFFIESGR
jgi:hypothetical protein